jgi:hypothetical protein
MPPLDLVATKEVVPRNFYNWDRVFIDNLVSQDCHSQNIFQLLTNFIRASYMILAKCE